MDSNVAYRCPQCGATQYGNAAYSAHMDYHRQSQFGGVRPVPSPYSGQRPPWAR